MSITSVVNDLVTSVSIINALKPLPPTISGYSVGGVDDTALDPAGGQTVQINGTGFLAGATITFDGSAVAVVTYVNPNRLTFTSPAKTAGTYTIYAVNPDGGTAIFIPGIIYSVLPTWTTAAGSLGSYYETTSISNTVVASGDAPITYSLFSGSLPTGSTLYANGVITGTAPVDSSSTTYSFTIQATDAQLQDSTRSFSLTINVDAVTWVSPANATTYTSAVNSAISNVALSATDAAGYAVSYSANALPTGISLTGANISGTPTVIADSSTLLTATAATTNRSATRTINWSITVANDIYFEYNTLLIPGASTTFVDDASTNNFAVSIFGDTKPNSFNPYTPGYYSNYFNGSTSYLNIGSTVPATLVFGTSDFTVECWVNFASIPAGTCLMGNLNAGSTVFGVWSIYFYGSPTYKISFFCNAPAVGYDFAYTITPNQWVHLAICRASGSIRAFINGVQIGSTQSSSVNITNSGEQAGGFYIGRANDGVGYFPGYLSNIRILKGTGLYTAAFTPPTSPLTAIANTSLLTSQSNRFIDNSTNTYTLTAGTSTQASSFQPFTPNSSYSTYGGGYFDGTGDYLTVPANSGNNFGTENFTIEAWIYSTSAGNRRFYSSTGASTILFRQENTNALRFYVDAVVDFSSSTLLTFNTWNHAAIVRNGSTFTIYLNGVSVGTATSASSMPTTTSTITYISTYDGTNEGWVGYISNLRVVKGVAVYTGAFTVPTSPLTATQSSGTNIAAITGTSTSLLVLQNNQSVNNSVFLDNSTNNFLVTRAGNTTQGTFSPYGGNWSNYVDTAYQGISNATSLIGATVTTFTAECWIYMTVAPASSDGVPCLIGMDALPASSIYLGFGPNASRQLVLRWFDGASKTATGGTALALNTWYHVAVVSNSNSLAMYVNGVAETLSGTTTLTNRNGTASSFALMSNSSVSAYQFKGYVSNIRVTTTAVYTSSFTPSTTPLTPITGTKLLTSQSNRIVDSSINNYTLTLAGSVTIQRFSPFNPSIVTPTSYSGYFDGTGDYLSVPANTAFDFRTGDFTIECWIYAPNGIVDYSDTVLSKGQVGVVDYANWAFQGSGTGGNLNFFGPYSINYATTTTQPWLTGWAHLAMCRSGSNTRCFLNGTQVGTTYTTLDDFLAGNPVIIGGGYYDPPGRSFKGYISNVRLVKGTALYTSNFTPPTGPLTAVAGTSLLTCQSSTFIDNSTNNFTLSAFGNSQPTQQNPFGFTSVTTNGYTVSTIGGSGYFDGTGDYLSFANSPTFANLNGNNFTVECWAYATTVASNICLMACTSNPTTTGFAIFILSGNLTVYVNTGSTVVGSIAFPTNTWNHVAFVRNSTTCTLYLNGVFVASATANITNPAATQPLVVGGITSSTGWNSNLYLTGYLSDARVVNGTALYTSNFVPPSAPLTAVQNTSALNNMTSAGIYDAAMMNNMETVADAKLSTAISKFGGSSMYFDGTGDYLVSPSNAVNSLGTDFTIEAWVYPTVATGTYGLTVAGTYDGISNGGWSVIINRSSNGPYGLAFIHANALQSTYGTYLSINTWTYIAVSRSGSTIRLFVNGTIVTTTTYATADSVLAPLNVGSQGAGASIFQGYMDDLRITKGYARYTSNFTAPTSAFPIY